MTTAHIGAELRAWRGRRRLSQLELGLDAGVSARHLSCVETGRAHPGRATLGRLLAALDVPPRERNRLLVAAGHAPAFPERALDHPDLAAARAAIGLVLERHEPFPAVAFDRRWELVAANRGMARLARGVPIAPELLEPPVNVVRVGLHPRGLAPIIRNLGPWRAQIRERLVRQHEPALDALIAELDGYPAPAGEPGDGVLGPLHLETPDGVRLQFLGMLATFETPFDVTASEIAIELLFPADAATAAALRGRG